MRNEMEHDEHRPVEGYRYGNDSRNMATAGEGFIREVVENSEKVQSGEPRVWNESDDMALEVWIEAEFLVPFLAPKDGVVTTDESYELFSDIGRLHGAVPFSDAERHWLVDKYRDMSDDKQRSRLREQEIHLMSGGVRQVVQGRDLMRRWWSWRRQVDEFEGQRSLDAAIEAMQKIVDKVTPPELPDTEQPQD